MKSGKHLILILVALALGGGATWLSYNLIQTEVAERTGHKDEKKVGVVVATSDLATGAVLDASMLAVREIPEAYITSDSLLPDNVGQIEGGRLLRPIKGGEQLLLSSVSRVADQAFSSTLKPGSRALTFAVDDINSISGMLTPEDRIDLLMVYTRGEQQLSMPLLQNVRVLATGQTMKSSANEASAEATYSNITLELTPLEARKLTLAQASGTRLTSILRSPTDAAPMTNYAASFNELVINGGQGNARAARSSSYGIAVYVGGNGDLKPTTTRVANPKPTAEEAMKELTALLQKEQQPMLAAPSTPTNRSN